MTAVLDFIGEDLARVPDSRAWISTKRFTFSEPKPDRALLACLIEHRQYADHYAGEPVEQQTHDALHGPYELASISPGTFAPSTASAARARLVEWASARASDGVPATSPDLARFLADELPSALSQPGAAVYELPDTREATQHDWGWVVGSHGFHEFVAIDRDALQLALIVASDD